MQDFLANPKVCKCLFYHVSIGKKNWKEKGTWNVLQFAHKLVMYGTSQLCSGQWDNSQDAAFRCWKKLRYSRTPCCEQQVVVGARWHVGTKIIKLVRAVLPSNIYLLPSTNHENMKLKHNIKINWNNQWVGASCQRNISGRLLVFPHK